MKIIIIIFGVVLNVVKTDEQEPDTTFDDFDKLFADDEENIVMKALDGFLIVLSTDGDIIYVSENIHDIIGIQQVRIFVDGKCNFSVDCVTSRTK